MILLKKVRLMEKKIIINWHKEDWMIDNPWVYRVIYDIL